MLLIVLLNILPLVLLGLTGWLYRREEEVLVSWRRSVFLSALIANGLSAAVLLSFIVQAYLISKGTKPVDIDRTYPVLSMLVVGLLAAVLAIAGKRVSRLLLIGDGLLTALLWYLAAMGASA